jgi:hypothetical protein
MAEPSDRRLLGCYVQEQKSLNSFVKSLEVQRSKSFRNLCQSQATFAKRHVKLLSGTPWESLTVCRPADIQYTINRMPMQDSRACAVPTVSSIRSKARQRRPQTVATSLTLSTEGAICKSVNKGQSAWECGPNRNVSNWRSAVSKTVKLRAFTASTSTDKGLKTSTTNIARMCSSAPAKACGNSIQPSRPETRQLKGKYMQIYAEQTLSRYSD